MGRWSLILWDFCMGIVQWIEISELEFDLLSYQYPDTFFGTYFCIWKYREQQTTSIDINHRLANGFATPTLIESMSIRPWSTPSRRFVFFWFTLTTKGSRNGTHFGGRFTHCKMYGNKKSCIVWVGYIMTPVWLLAH